MYIVSPPLQRNSTKNSVYVPLIDVSTRLPITGKFSANVTCTLVGEHDVTGSMNLSDLSNVKANWNSGGWSEVHATQFPGLYRLDLPNKKFVDDGQSANLYLCVQCAGAEIVYMQIPLGHNAVSTSPGFTNAGSNDYTLASGSAARDTGATLASVTADLLAVSRPQNSLYDKGAYEYVVSAGGGSGGQLQDPAWDSPRRSPFWRR